MTATLNAQSALSAPAMIALRMAIWARINELTRLKDTVMYERGLSQLRALCYELGLEYDQLKRETM